MTQEQQHPYFNMIDYIFRVETYETFPYETVQEYEEKHRSFVFESLADAVDDEELEEAISFNYNGDNLVSWFKKLEN